MAARICESSPGVVGWWGKVKKASARARNSFEGVNDAEQIQEE